MNPESIYDIIIVGGGLAGLVSAIVLSKAGFKVLLLEKKKYPFHKVCGEYVSNEVLNYLVNLGFNPFDYGASRIERLRVSDPSGKSIFIKLDMGGFGISRYKMDHLLSMKARESGVTVIENCRVNDIIPKSDFFQVSSSDDIFHSRFVIGSYGKRAILDKKFQREFINKRTRYMGVKYHIKIDYPADEIGLDNFPGGYCGIVKIEDDKYNLCYLYRRRKNEEYKSIPEIEEKILFTNPILKNIFQKSVFISSSPEVINEISFDKKSCVEDHVFLCGDSAGLITPLCGNGMAMAVHGAKLLTEILIQNASPGKSPGPVEREIIENTYQDKWNAVFANRIFWGRNLQKISGNPLITSASLKIIHSIPSIEKWLISKTHGKEVSQ